MQDGYVLFELYFPSSEGFVCRGVDSSTEEDFLNTYKKVEDE